MHKQKRYITLALAIFDLDNTLLSGDSDHLWGVFLVEKGVVDGEVYQREGEQWQQYSDGNWETMKAIGQSRPVPAQPRSATKKETTQGFVPAHKRTLSRSELDRQELARLEGFENYARYRLEKERE